MRSYLKSKKLRLVAATLAICLISSNASAAILAYDAQTGLTWDWTTVTVAIMGLLVGVIGAAVMPFVAQKGWGVAKRIFGKS